MFKKPYAQQSRTLLKSSATRAVKEQIAAAFPALTAEQLSLLFPAKCAITAEKLSSPPHPTLYSVTPSRPLFFSYTPVNACASSSSSASSSGDATHFCPTVYALWLCPQLLPPVFIHPAVSPALIRGADLMLPGVLRPANQSYNLKRGQLRSVVARGNPAPLAVGEVAVDEAEAVAAGWTGRGLRVLQCYGDALYGASDRVVPNEGFKGGKVDAVISSEEARLMLDAAIDEGKANGEAVEQLLQLREQVESKMSLKTNDSKTGSEAKVGWDGRAIDTDSSRGAEKEGQSVGVVQASEHKVEEREEEERKDRETKVAGEDANDGDNDNQPASKESSVSIDVMDACLLNSLLLAIKTDLPDDVFPLTASVLLSRYMESCNATPHRLELKQSSYKKMGKFVKAMQKQALLFCKEKQGDTLVTAVHRQHPDVLTVVADKEWREAVKAKAKAREKELKERERRRDEEESGDAAGGGLLEAEKQPLTILHKYKPSAQVRAVLFSESEEELFSMKEAKQQLADYCKRQQLDDGGSVRLDAALAEAVFDGKASEGSRMSKAALSKAFDSHLTLYAAVVLPTASSAQQPSFHRGDVQPVVVSVEQRAGNRTVTRLSGLDRFGVDVAEWGREAARHYAASVTSEESKGGKKGARDVLVQGDCRPALAERLWREHGIPREYVRLEAKGKGKEKR